MSASYAVQKAIRARLVGTPAVVALVPADAILDRNARPAPKPSIVLGEDVVADEGDLARRGQRVFSTIHVWKTEPGLAGVKAIEAAIRKALATSRLALPDGFHCADCRVSGARFLRDPDGETAHGVVTIETLAVDAS